MTSVLIVDDDPSFRRLAADLLGGLGYALAGEAGNGADAVAAVARLRPDAVLLDVGLPDVDGVTLARRLAGPRILLTSSDPCPLDDPALRFVAKAELATTDLAPYLRG